MFNLDGHITSLTAAIHFVLVMMQMDDGSQDKGQPPVVPEEASEAVQRMLDFIKKLRPEGKKVHGYL